MSSTEPKGDLTSGLPARFPSPTTNLPITSVDELTSNTTLVPLNLSHGADLFKNLGGPQNSHLYTYMPYEPLISLEDLNKHIDLLVSIPNLQPYAILSADERHLSNQQPYQKLNTEAPSPSSAQNLTSDQHPPQTAIGIIALINIVPTHRTVEVGHVLFANTLQRTTAATEACYLLIKHAFEDLGYLRVEWKANSFNEASRRAALRLGFTYEGRFRKHMVVKGRRRDSDWFSVLDDEVCSLFSYCSVPTIPLRFVFP
jgi:RimJ/RimL family protein N-acetyltransferase